MSAAGLAGPFTITRCTALPSLLTCAAGAEAGAGLLVVVVVVVVGKVPAAGAGAAVVLEANVALAPFIIIPPASSALSMMEVACRGRRTGMGQALTPPLSSEAMILSVGCGLWCGGGGFDEV